VQTDGKDGTGDDRIKGEKSQGPPRGTGFVVKKGHKVSTARRTGGGLKAPTDVGGRGKDVGGKMRKAINLPRNNTFAPAWGELPWETSKKKNWGKKDRG